MFRAIPVTRRDGSANRLVCHSTTTNTAKLAHRIKIWQSNRGKGSAIAESVNWPPAKHRASPGSQWIKDGVLSGTDIYVHRHPEEKLQGQKMIKRERGQTVSFLSFKAHEFHKNHHSVTFY